MRKVLAIVLGLFFMIKFFTGCSKKDNNNSPQIQQIKSWKMSATIGTTKWQTDSVTGFVNHDSASGVSSIVIGGITAGDSALAIGVLYGIDPGNYDLNKGSGYSLTFVVGNSTEYVSTSGTLYIGSNSNKTLSGTFEATLSEINGPAVGSNVTIAKGFFRISY